MHATSKKSSKSLKRRTKLAGKFGSLKIGSGAFRGRKLITPDSELTHPMGSREKNALFNTLESLNSPLTSVKKVLDLYCGSGALGLEAISRGVKEAVFVDKNHAALQALRQNIATLGLAQQTTILRANLSTSAIATLAPALGDEKFDLILVDPPYDNFPKDLSFLPPLLNTDQSILVLSHPSSVNAKFLFPELKLLCTKSYAAANLSFFSR